METLNFNYYFEIISALYEFSSQVISAIIPYEALTSNVVFIEDPVTIVHEVNQFFTETMADFVNDTIENCLLFVDLILAFSKAT